MHSLYNRTVISFMKCTLVAAMNCCLQKRLCVCMYGGGGGGGGGGGEQGWKEQCSLNWL